MFTGLIKDRGEVASITDNAEGKLLVIKTRLAPMIGVDDSVAVNGVCLTAIHSTPAQFSMQVVHVTLEKTSLGQLEVGSKVNLELALKYSDRLGGHLVQGHVNGVARVESLSHRGENYHVWLSLPIELMKYVAKEGSIALDGISLTVAEVKEEGVMVALIPHTWKETIASSWKEGSVVNVEVDANAVMMARYLDVLFANYVKERNI